MRSKVLLLVAAVITIAVLAWPAVGAPSLTNFTDQVWIRAAGATAVPALQVNQLGAGKIVEFLDGGTPVFSVNNGGAITGGRVLAYPTAGIQINCKTNTITDTASYTATVTAISTPIFATCTLNAITGDAEKCAAIVGSGNVTITVRNSAATPAANTTGAAVTWCTGGTPQ
jgi:hypothetical protein